MPYGRLMVQLQAGFTFASATRRQKYKLRAKHHAEVGCDSSKAGFTFASATRRQKYKLRILPEYPMPNEEGVLKDALFIWQGRLDSNQRVTDPETVALPLGHTPIKNIAFLENFGRDDRI